MPTHLFNAIPYVIRDGSFLVTFKPEGAAVMIPLFYRRSDDFLALKCPECGGFYLQFKRVEIFDTDDGDRQDEGLHVSVDHEVASVDKRVEGFLGERRHGLTIEFVCGECGKRSMLRVNQHNGSTLIDFSVV